MYVPIPLCRLLRFPVSIALVAAFVTTLLVVNASAGSAAAAAPSPPATCWFTWSGDTATVGFTRQANDGANRQVLERRVDEGRWLWTDRINVYEPWSSTWTRNPGEHVGFRLKSRSLDGGNSPFIPCIAGRSGPPIAPAACAVTPSGNTVDIEWTPADRDRANRWVVERRLPGDSWRWHDRVNIHKIPESTDRAPAGTAWRVKSRDLANANSAYTACDEPTGIDPSSILWSADHETGDLQQWSADMGWQWWDDERDAVVGYDTGSERYYGDAVFNSRTAPGNCVTTVTDEIARSGDFSMKHSLTGASNASQGCRTFRTYLGIDGADAIALPDEAYYSAWYYLPTAVETDVWWNIFQFKSRSDELCPDRLPEAESLAMLSFDVIAEGGDRYMHVYHKKPCEQFCADSCQWESYGQTAESPIPVGEWFHVEAFLSQSTWGDDVNQDGRVTLWINGVEVIDRDGIQTQSRPGDIVQWSVNNYTDNIFPADVDLYIDDAAISTERLGVG